MYLKNLEKNEPVWQHGTTPTGSNMSALSMFPVLKMSLNTSEEYD